MRPPVVVPSTTPDMTPRPAAALSATPATRVLAGEVVSRAPRPTDLAPSLPGFTDLHYDPAGYLWAIEYHPPWEDGAGALIFTLDGELLGRMELPADFRILDIRENQLLGAQRNDLDVETIQRFRLSRGP